MTGPGWPDARGWIGIGVFSMSVMLLWMMKDPALREDEFFQTIATLVIGTGFVGGLVSWAYAATKGGGEMAESSARIAEQAATAAVKRASGGKPAPQSAKEGADQVSDAAADEADEIGEREP